MTALSKHKPLLLFILILIGFQFLFLVSYAPFLHNHPLNKPEKDSCPAFIINIDLITATIFLLFIFLLVFPHIVALILLLDEKIFQKITFATVPSRSPPFFS